MKNIVFYKCFKAVGLVLALLMASCQSNPYPGIPGDSELMDSGYRVKLFRHIDDSTCHPMKVSVWAFYEETKRAERIVSTTGEDVAVWCKSDTVRSVWPKDSIASIYSAKIISWADQPLRIVVDGCPDQRNVWTYIVSEESDSAILLPTNAGFLGCTSEENLLIAQSYEYYGQCGRYNVLKVFDSQGNVLKVIPVNKNVNVPDELYQAALYNDWNLKIDDLQRLVTEHPDASVSELIELAKSLWGK